MKFSGWKLILFFNTRIVFESNLDIFCELKKGIHFQNEMQTLLSNLEGFIHVLY